ncbi:interferon-inducible GTPase 5-like [Ornithorhynchus anatinus]|uniref:interferon-inducible GTPase 5-like n=1 Tax=Ornithorhynchus anatinus TaxID=9258 RepID=UPI0010A93189|nr:interferon-inducible GTPase 5-like [Ornithorhynchus anatinus]
MAAKAKPPTGPGASSGQGPEEKNFLQLSAEELGALREAFEDGNLSAAARKLQDTLQSLENVRLDVAVTGETGSGKSTFVNAIRGLGDEEPGSAETGVVETTLDPTPYPHPKYPNVTIWDLPGIGTPAFQASRYLERVQFGRYDFFILIASERFTAHHAQLACEIQRLGKRFYFIRSKVDVDLAASRQRRPATFSEEGVLNEIRTHCRDRLRAEGVAEPRVFLLSTFELGKYDFHLLGETLERELEGHKRHALLLALPNVSRQILDKKRASLQQHIWLIAAISCGLDPVPVPQVPGLFCDLKLLVKALQGYYRNFGLDRASLATLADQVAKPAEALKAVMRSPDEVDEALVVQLLGQVAGGVGGFTQQLETVPILGALASGGVSFAIVYKALRLFLTMVEEDCQRVLLKAFEVEPRHPL